MPLQEGQLLEGKYRVTRQIAAGGMADIYLGVNERLGKDVAVKVLQPHVAHDPVTVRRFEREARIAARIASTHIADVFDFGELPTGERFMVMEYLIGESLGERLERERRLPLHVIADVALQTLDALAAAHSAGIVHRDLKPDNIFLTRRDRDDFVKVLDFGISKQQGPRSAARQTGAGMLLGTPMYMSPEQARGGGEIDLRTDIYALGVILYEAASGDTPFPEHDSVVDLLFRVTRGEPTPIEERLPEVDPLLATIVRTAMAKDPSDRYSNAQTMRDAILEWQASLPVDPLAGAIRRMPAMMPERAGVDTGATLVFEMPTVRRRRHSPAWLALPLVAAAISVTLDRASWARWTTWTTSTWTKQSERFTGAPLRADDDVLVVADRVFDPPPAPVLERLPPPELEQLASPPPVAPRPRLKAPPKPSSVVVAVDTEVAEPVVIPAQQ